MVPVGVPTEVRAEVIQGGARTGVPTIFGTDSPFKNAEKLVGTALWAPLCMLAWSDAFAAMASSCHLCY